MFVGDTGVQRVVTSTCQAMRQAGIDDPADLARLRKLGVIDLPTLQKKINLHFSLTLDLFGSEISTNAANAFNASLKGRYREDKLDDDHQLRDATYPVLRLSDGTIATEQRAALSSLNMRLRDDYVAECEHGVARWNRIIANAGIGYRLALPHVAFNRRVGEFSRVNVDTGGELVDEGSWRRRQQDMLPTAADGEYIASLMQPVYDRGQFAPWIAPPKVGIDNKPGDFEYVRIEP